MRVKESRDERKGESGAYETGKRGEQRRRKWGGEVSGGYIGERRRDRDRRAERRREEERRNKETRHERK